MELEPVEIIVNAPRATEDALKDWLVAAFPAAGIVQDAHLKRASIEAQVRTPAGSVDVILKVEVIDG